MNKNRHARRALLARLRCSIAKGHAFGRVAVLAHEEGPTGQDCGVVIGTALAECLTAALHPRC